MPKPDHIFFISLVALPIMVFKLILRLYEWYTDWKLLRTGTETTGTIVDEARYDPCPDEGTDSPSYSSHFLAEYAVGTATYRVLSRFIDRKHAMLGWQYVILYDPKKPERARFKCDHTLIWPVRLWLVALVIDIAIVVYGYMHLDF